MNIMPTHRQKDDEDELGAVLPGVSSDPNEKPRSAIDLAGLQFEDPAAPPEPPAPAPTSPPPAAATPVSPPTPSIPIPTATPSTPSLPNLPSSNSLEDLKKSALEELRPLVSKLNVSPEEKFDALLLIIRSTDDQSLLAAAHEAAQNIADESKKAEALLDIVKEVDYFSNQGR